MKNDENDYEPIINEQAIFSHIYREPDQFLLNYYTRPVSNSTKTEKMEKNKRKNNRRKTHRMLKQHLSKHT